MLSPAIPGAGLVLMAVFLKPGEDGVVLAELFFVERIVVQGEVAAGPYLQHIGVGPPVAGVPVVVNFPENLDDIEGFAVPVADIGAQAELDVVAFFVPIVP